MGGGARRLGSVMPAIFMCAGLFAVEPLSAEDSPHVAASILPLHALAGAVSEGVGEPALLLEGGASPHSFSLRPSDARDLADAEVVIWIGEDLELFLRRPLETVAANATVLTVSELEGITLLPVREAGLHSTAEHDHDNDHDHDHDHDAGHGHDHAHGSYDPHLWLDPANARVIAAAIAETLAEVDPGHTEQYRANAAQLQARLTELEADLRAQLEPLKGATFLVFHDGYQYFEAAFDLPSAGALSLGPERQPGAQRLKEIRAWIAQEEAVCLFSEPQFEPRLARVVVEGTDARLGELDPLGATLAPGPHAYEQLLRALADSLTDCLAVD
ncbi:zinc ABC transporter substrate-binding protein ZnuA [Aquibaculum sediminis]|uniref:zinc ABC transporter substrate-binding protein ZnuA n=1 Tax=Aquibaculum sediminis TaxID=3231907 RepID=UPI0034519E95